MVPTIGQQPITKIHKLGDEMLYASNGAIRVGQLLRDSLERLCAVKGYAKAQSSAQAMGLIASKIAEEVKKLFDPAGALVPLVGQQTASATVLCKSLVAVPFRGRARLFQFDYSGTPEEGQCGTPVRCSRQRAGARLLGPSQARVVE